MALNEAEGNVNNLDNLNEEEKIKELERMEKLVQSNHQLLRKHYSIECLEDLLEQVKDDQAYIVNFTREYDDYNLNSIKFELRSQSGWMFLAETQQKKWWEFWKQ